MRQAAVERERRREDRSATGFFFPLFFLPILFPPTTHEGQADATSCEARDIRVERKIKKWGVGNRGP